MQYLRRERRLTGGEQHSERQDKGRLCFCPSLYKRETYPWSSRGGTDFLVHVSIFVGVFLEASLTLWGTVSRMGVSVCWSRSVRKED